MQVYMFEMLRGRFEHFDWFFFSCSLFSAVSLTTAGGEKTSAAADEDYHGGDQHPFKD